ncbi:hypothetical protein niasHS_012884 [Heterodera schachtii]
MVVILKKFAKYKGHEKADSCVLMIMTHGHYDQIYGVDDRGIDTREFIARKASKVERKKRTAKERKEEDASDSEDTDYEDDLNNHFTCVRDGQFEELVVRVRNALTRRKRPNIDSLRVFVQACRGSLEMRGGRTHSAGQSSSNATIDKPNTSKQSSRSRPRSKARSDKKSTSEKRGRSRSRGKAGSDKKSTSKSGETKLLDRYLNNW